jgi:dihydroorotase
VKRATMVRGGRLLDPANELDETGDLLVVDGEIAAVGRIGEIGEEMQAEAEVVDARGLWVCPGFVDLHSHLREPGEEHKETIETGARAAAAGGFTTICAMPNTEPPLDSRGLIEFVLRRSDEAGFARVLPIGAVTKGRRGKELTEMVELAEVGAIAFSDDGSPVDNAAVMRNALSYARMLGLPVMNHCEVPELAHGVMAEGIVATALGLPGVPAEMEDIMIARDLMLARLSGGHIHVCHVSTKGGVELIRRAKSEGIKVTAEVTPHHLTMTDELVMGIWPALFGERRRAPYDTNCRVNPPLRTMADALACAEGLADGTLDAIATDHAPHSPVDKGCEFGCAAPGMVGFEVAVPLLLLADRAGWLDYRVSIAALTGRPAGVLRRELGALTAGYPADLALIDPEREWRVEPQNLHGRSHNTPLLGETVRGKCVGTLLAGRWTHSEVMVGVRG